MKNVFVSVFGDDRDSLIAMIKQAKLHTNCFELRFDLCGNWKYENFSLRSLFPKQSTVIFTDRSQKNSWEKHDQKSIFEFELKDLEIEKIDSHTNISEKSTVLSAHVFSKFSSEKIKTILKKLKKHSVRWYKLAVNLDTFEDLLDFYMLTKALPQKKWLLMGMGKYGKISRGIFATQGFGTFACVPNQSIVAGQIDIITLKQTLI